MDLLTANDREGEYPRSWYAATATPLAPFPKAEGEISCDVCVIGGGYTGLSAALHLRERGYDVVLIEAQRVGFGASGRNGGQAGMGQRQDQDWLERVVGRALARQLWDLAAESVALTKDLAARHAPDAPWRGGIISAAHRPRYVPEYHAYAERMERDYGYDQLRPLDADEMRALVGSPAYHGGMLDLGGGHLHPLNLALGLARAARDAGVRIFEGSFAESIEEGDPARVIIRGSARITARFVAIGGDGYLGRLERRVAEKVMPINNFIAATRVLTQEEQDAALKGGHAVADSKFVVNYFRLSEDGRLLFGGGETYGYRFPPDIRATVRRALAPIFPQLERVEFTHAWGGTLGITMNRMPHFERLTGNILTAGGYSGHGLAMGILGGKLLAEAISGQAERFDLMAAVPSHRFPGGPALRLPLLTLAMLWYSLRDRF